MHTDHHLLWPDGAPHAAGTNAADQPALTIHLPARGRANGAAIIVNPGGGYRILASDHEGLQVARWLNSIGVAAFVLRYRLGTRYSTDVSLLDGQRAVRYVRQKADAFGLSPTRIGMLGFSAGGHLTVAVGTQFDSGNPNAADPIERMSCRPDFLVPIYAVTNGVIRGRKADEYTATDTRVDASTPPTFLVHTHEDSIVSAEQSLLFYRACLAAGVQAELHVFGYSDHGVGLSIGDPDTQHWTLLLQRWLRRTGMLTDKRRVAVTGRLRIDNETPGYAWITLTPDDDNAPSANVRVYAGGDGSFAIDAAHGPVTGPHRVQVHQLSTQIYDRDGGYSMNDTRHFERRVDVKADAVLELSVRS